MTSSNPRQSKRVAAVFQNAVVSFEVARQTTLEQLAGQLGVLAETHGRLMLPVHVRMEATRRPCKPVQPGRIHAWYPARKLRQRPRSATRPLIRRA